MILDIRHILRRKKEETDFLSTSLGAAFTSWKIAYGFAIHGNYTFHLPLEEVNRRWDITHEAEETFVGLLITVSKLLKVRPTAVAHIIEVEIERLQARREAVLADPLACDKVGVDDLDKRIEAARTLLADAMEASDED